MGVSKFTFGAFTSSPWSIINWAHSTEPLLQALCNAVSFRLFRAATLAPAWIRANAHLTVVSFSYLNPKMSDIHKSASFLKMNTPDRRLLACNMKRCVPFCVWAIHIFR